MQVTFGGAKSCWPIYDCFKRWEGVRVVDNHFPEEKYSKMFACGLTLSSRKSCTIILRRPNRNPALEATGFYPSGSRKEH